MSYDSTADTLKHIKRVNTLLIYCVKEVLNRATKHDASKLVSPEKEGFDEHTHKLSSLKYGSQEYKDCLSELQPILQHHYARNSHHPEHYKNGINDMDLFDLIEMFFDWKAASERQNDGNILVSVQKNKEKYGMSDQLLRIFENTTITCDEW